MSQSAGPEPEAAAWDGHWEKHLLEGVPAVVTQVRPRRTGEAAVPPSQGGASAGRGGPGGRWVPDGLSALVTHFLYTCQLEK